MRDPSDPFFKVVPPFFTRGRNQRSDSGERSDDVNEVTQEPEPLEPNEDKVPVVFHEEVRKHLDGDGRGHVHEQRNRDDEPNVCPLVRENDGVKPEAAVARAILGSLADDAKIVNEKRPNEEGEDGIEGEPHERIANMVKGQHLDQGAGEIEKIVHEFERPSDEGEGMNAGPRPEKQDDQKRNCHVGPGGSGAMRHHFTGIFRQKSEGHALDDAGQSQLDINDDFVELTAAGGRGFHAESGSGWKARLSIPAAAIGAKSTLPANSGEILRVNQQAKPIQVNGPQ